MDTFLVPAVGGVVAAAVAAALQLLVEERSKSAQRAREDVASSLEARIDTLTTSLRSAARDIEEIEREIAARQRLVEELRADADTYKALVKMNERQVSAIVSQLQSVVGASTETTKRWTTRMTLVAVAVGVIVAVLVGVTSALT